MRDSGRRHRFAAAISMYDEFGSVFWNVEKQGHEFEQIEVSQSSLTPHPRLVAALDAHPCAHYHLFPNLNTIPGVYAEHRGWGAPSITRNFSHAFRAIRDGGVQVDYVIALFGDTAIVSFWGIEEICSKMEQSGAEVGCSRAMGQKFLPADLTVEELADPNGRRGERLQDYSNKDFMPQFWIVAERGVHRFCDVKVTNPWCSEQCFGDAAGDATMLVFASGAYTFGDGIIYHVPSKTNWVHDGQVEVIYDEDLAKGAPRTRLY